MKGSTDEGTEVISREGPGNHSLIFVCDKNNNINAEVFIAFPQVWI